MQVRESDGFEKGVFLCLGQSLSGENILDDALLNLFLGFVCSVLDLAKFIKGGDGFSFLCCRLFGCFLLFFSFCRFLSLSVLLLFLRQLWDDVLVIGRIFLFKQRSDRFPSFKIALNQLDHQLLLLYLQLILFEYLQQCLHGKSNQQILSPSIGGRRLRSQRTLGNPLEITNQQFPCLAGQ